MCSSFQREFLRMKDECVFRKVIPRHKLICLILTSVSCAFIGFTAYASSSVEGIQVYNNNVHLSPEHKRKLAADINRYHNADNLWDVLREEFSLPHYENSPAVQAKIEWFMNNQDFLLRSASRSAPYLYYILQQVKKRHLPAELVLLPIVESGYNPFNRSPVGAAGIWQLMPSTASGLGVKQNGWYDGRRDVIASTHAALNYLAYLQSFFEGNWLWAIAAYNTGEGNVLSAIKKNIRAGYDTSFWSLPLAQETRDYVPSLLALAIIISHPERYPVYFPPVRNAPYLAQVAVATKISVKDAAQLAGLNYNRMLQLNPGFKNPTKKTKSPYKLVLPIENVVQFSENLANSPFTPTQINWIHYKVKSGDTLASVAKKFRTTTVALRKLNHITKSSLRHGSQLLIPQDDDDVKIPTRDIAPRIEVAAKSTTKHQPEKQADFITFASSETNKQIMANNTDSQAANSNYSLQPGDTIYMVRKKDTLAGIAKRFRTTSQIISLANNLKGKNIKPGVQLIIPTHVPTIEIANAFTATKNIEGGDTIYVVRHGDTIEKIANKFHTSPSAIRIANLMGKSTLQEGDNLVIPTHLQG